MRQTRGIYLISVVAETLNMHPQTLRKYERAGFIEPFRMGALRTYSDEDVARLRLIKHFVDDLGLNLSGVQMALGFTNELLALRTRLASAPGRSDVVDGSIAQVDGMLATLGVRVVRRAEAADSTQPPPPPGDGSFEGSFQVSPGESVEFDLPPQGANTGRGARQPG